MLLKRLVMAAGLSMLMSSSIPNAEAQAATSATVIKLNNEGVKALATGNFAFAIQKFEEAVRLDPTYALARSNLAIAYNNYALQLAGRRDYKQALDSFANALFLDPQNPATAANLDGICKMLNIDPKSFASQVYLGDQAFADRRKPGAVVHYTLALNMQHDESVKRRLDAILHDDYSQAPMKPTMQPVPLVTKAAPGAATNTANISAAPGAATNTAIVSAAPGAATNTAIVSAAPGAATNTANISANTSVNTPQSSVNNATGTNRPIKDKWALIVGISKFQNQSLNLKFPDKDAVDFGNFLVKDCHFAADHVKVLTNEKATRASILDELGDKWLPRVVRPDDLVVLYFSTHGSPSDVDVGGVNYLLASDTDPERLYSSGLPMQDLMRVIKGRLRSDRVIVILDACYSGNASAASKGIHRQSNVDAEEIAQGTGQLVISSSSANQASWESTRQPNSVFTRHLMTALRANGDKTKLGDAFRLLKDRVEEEVQRDRGKLQTPILKSVWQGDELILSVPPSDPRPGF